MWVYNVVCLYKYINWIYISFNLLIYCDLVENGFNGKLGKVVYLEDWIIMIMLLIVGELVFKVIFDYD